MKMAAGSALVCAALALAPVVSHAQAQAQRLQGEIEVFAATVNTALEGKV